MSNNKEIKPAASLAPTPADNNNITVKGGEDAIVTIVSASIMRLLPIQVNSRGKSRISSLKSSTIPASMTPLILIAPSRIMPTIYNFSSEMM
jgi:hypothetical protein